MPDAVRVGAGAGVAFGTATIKVYVRVVVVFTLSITWIVNVYVPVVVGVMPLMTPVALFSVRPVGNVLPLASVYRYPLPLPPVAVICWRYGTPGPAF